jgi:hypothetical protein
MHQGHSLSRRRIPWHFDLPNLLTDLNHRDCFASLANDTANGVIARSEATKQSQPSSLRRVPRAIAEVVGRLNSIGEKYRLNR